MLAEQPPDTWDSFPLFQILNDYLRTDGAFFFLGIIGRDILKYIRAIFAYKILLNDYLRTDGAFFFSLYRNDMKRHS